MIVAVVAAVSFASTARAAQTVVVDFEAGPTLNTTPVTDEYLTTSFVRFIREDLGFRPYRRSVVPARARSGSVVVDVGADVCTMEEVGENCEFPGAGTKGRLSRTATSVTVFAGLFRPAGGGRQVTARLVALRADGSEAASSPAVPVNATNFRTPVTVTSAASDIAAFALHAEGPGATGGSALGFDDLTLTFPDNSLPDVSAAIGGGELVLLQGRSLDVPLRLQRLNGSAGPLRLSVSGLPAGITAALVPNPVTGTQDNAVLRLTAPPTAAASFTPFTVTADPQGNGSVGSAVRTAAGMLRVAANFELEAGATGPARLPHCAPVEFPLHVPRSSAFTGVITLTAENLPPGVTADFAPDDTLGPAGSFVYTPSLTLRRGTGAIPQAATVRVRASSPGAPDRTLLVPVAVATPTATIAGSGTGFAPMRERDGDERSLSGNGFCAGTHVEVGSAAASVPATVAADGRSLRFRIPRLALDGPVTVVPPGPGAPYDTANALDVRTFRNYYGFQFDNFDWGSLSFAELIDVVGADELFKRVNPCWPIYDCSFLTPIPNPWALASWQVMNGLVQASDGHCFGIMRTQQELLAGRVGYDRFTQGADHPYALGSSSGPGSELRHYLDGRHAAQFTKELVAAFLDREKNVNAQVQRIRAELQAGRYPGVALMPGTVKTAGHVVTAYDVKDVTGGFDVYVYDNNTPFRAGEGNHADKETGDSGVISVRSGRWSFDRGDKGIWSDSGGTLWAVPLSAIPRDPTLITGIGSLNLSMFLFGSADGAARVASIPAGAEWLPVLDDEAPPMAAGSLVAPGSRPLSHTITGTKDGSYNELLAAKGFTGAVTGVRTGKDVTDRITSKPAARALEFSGTRSRPLEMTVATTTPSGTATRTAIVRTTTAAGGHERAQLTQDGALVYEHQGKATRFSVELSSAGAARFVSGALRIADGDRVTADPSDWRSLSKVRLKVRRAGGARLARTLKARTGTSKVRVRIGRPRVLQTRRGAELRMKTRLSRVPSGTIGGVVLELKRGGDVMASRAIAVRRVGGGSRTDRWRLPNRLERGRYRVIARFTALSGGARAGRVTATRSAAIRLSR